MFYGEPKGGFVAFIKVQGIEALYKYVIEKNWREISEVQEQSWGAKTCTLGTPEGYSLHFFE
jgi:AraC family transcriptional regulator